MLAYYARTLHSVNRIDFLVLELVPDHYYSVVLEPFLSSVVLLQYVVESVVDLVP